MVVSSRSLLRVTVLRLCLHSLLFPALLAAETAERQLYLMGTQLHLAVTATTREQAEQAAEAAVRELEATERRLSTWREGSELARVNAAPPGRPVELSPRLCAELSRALRWAQRTGGAFDPTVGWLVHLYDLRGAGRWPSPGELDWAHQRTGFAALHLAGCQLTKVKEVLLEEGGFGKSAGLNRALAATRPWAKAAVLDLGGQVAFFGPEELEVALTHPQNRQHVVAFWRVPAGSVASSGNGERQRVVDGQVLGHLLDPGTARPAANFGSVSVWAPDALDADCLSTALFVLGPHAGMRWLSHWPEVRAVFLVLRGEGLELLATPNVGQLRVIDPCVKRIKRPGKPGRKGEKP